MEMYVVNTLILSQPIEMKRHLSIICFILFFSISAFAQEYEDYNIDSLLSHFYASQDTLTTVKNYNHQIDSIYKQGIADDQESFEELIRNVLELAKKLDDNDGIAWGKYHLAKWKIGISNDYENALPLLLEAASIFETTGNKNGVSMCYMQMGLISYISQYYDDAIKNFNVSLSFANNPTSVYLMAISYSELNEYGEAKTLFHRAIKEYKKLNRNKSLGECYMYLGRLYIQEGLLDSAFYFLNMALENLKQHQLDGYLSRPYALFAEYYFKRGDLPVAEHYALASIELSKSSNDNLSPIISSEILSKLYEKQNKFNKAFFYLKLHYELKNQDFEGGMKQKIAQMQTIFEFKKKIDEEKRKHEEEIRKKNQTRNIILISGLFVLLIAGGLASRLQYVRKSKAALQNEKNISENLLLNILPEEIALELKENGEAKARNFDLVSILFTDFKDFTEASAKMSASTLVGEINACFEAFDNILDRHSIEKIKTIGDSYMAAGGLPVPTAESVKNTVLAALEMQTFITKRKAENDAANKPAFEMRVGIHTGPVVAGIVGVKKFQYDIWGDTVNTASRIESNGVAGKVNISQATYELLKNDNDFAFEGRGKIEVKGKGEMEMWFVKLKPTL